MCQNRPSSKKISKMNGEVNLIKVGEKTNNSKYDFLRLFYTKWNQITNPRPRVIIDTHAGTGLVNLHTRQSLTRTNHSKEIYGSPLIAIIKTIKISQNLKIILNESDNTNFAQLKSYIDKIRKDGLPVFEKIEDDFRYKSLETGRKRKLKNKKKIIFPEEFNKKLPKGYKEVLTHSKGEIIVCKKKIEENIRSIIEDHLNKIDEKSDSKPIALFFVDPCGIVDWKKVIELICNRSNKSEGTEMILNWSWDAINRTLPTKYKNSTLSQIYGIPIEMIDQEFENIITMKDFLEKYLEQLRKYFKHVVEVGVPRDRKLKPKQSEHRKYFLILCTNNQSGLSLAGYQIEKIGEKLRNGVADMSTFIYQNNNSDN